MEAGPARPVAAGLDRPIGRSESAGGGLPLVDGSDRHHHSHGPRHVANGGDTGGTRTVANSGTNQGGPFGSGRPWREDGPQAPSVPPAGRPCPEADRTGRMP